MSCPLLKGQMYRIQGKVTDSLGLSVSFASIGIESEPEGTISNENGEFSMHVKTLPITLLISHVGYKTRKVLVKEADNLRVILSPAVRILPELYVSNLGLITMQKAYNKILKGEKKYSSKGFYRQTTVQGEEITNFIETYYDLDLNTVSNIEKYKIINGRYGSMKGDSASLNFVFTNFKSIPLGIRNIRKDPLKAKENRILFPMSPDMEEYYNFTIEDIYKDGDLEAVKIICSPLGKRQVEFEGAYYINNKTFQILKIEGFVKGEIGLSFKNDSKNYMQHNNGFSVLVGYKEFEGKSLIQYTHIKSTVETLFNDRKRTFKTSGTLYYFDYSSKSMRGGYKNSIKTHDFKEISKVKYDPVFWKENNPVKYTSEEDRAIEIYDKNKYFGTYFNE